MVCPVCGEALELEGYEVGDLVDCEACGAVLRLLSDGGLEVVVPPGGEKEPLWGLEAYGDGEEAVLRFSDGTLEEGVRVAKAELAEALHALPERCREVVLLRYRQGLSYKEIAVQLGISPETVKVHLAKGLRRCTDYFAERGLTGPAPS